MFHGFFYGEVHGRVCSEPITPSTMADYLSRMLRVDRETSPITVASISDLPLETQQFAADLVIAVAIRPLTTSSQSSVPRSRTSTPPRPVGPMPVSRI
jgi:hypothetical protein